MLLKRYKMRIKPTGDVGLILTEANIYIELGGVNIAELIIEALEQDLTMRYCILTLRWSIVRQEIK